MKKKVSLVEIKGKVRKFKEKIYYLKKCNIRIYYNPEVINKIIFIERKDFQNLLRNLELFERTLIEDKRLGKFQQSLWKIDIKDNKVLFISKNKSIKKELILEINLNDNKKLIIAKRIS